MDHIPVTIFSDISNPPWFVDKCFELAGNLILLWDAFDVILFQINLINLNLGLVCLTANVEFAFMPFTAHKVLVPEKHCSLQAT